MKKIAVIPIIALVIGIFTPAWCADTETRSNTSDLTQLSLEDLMNIQVTSVSKKAERLSDSAAAVYVITSEDIRRSGATSIPEALRMVPGLHVAKIDSNKWTVSSRGFAERFTNKLLVLIDGRSVYTPLFAGVYWDMQDTVMEDIDRIEVIRGPGATMWGANAVNGVINIITKNSNTTQGTLASEYTGNTAKGIGSIRYGGMLSENATYRVYGRYLNWDNAAYEDGQTANDGWEQNRRGFRVDWNLTKSSSLMVQGDFYNEVAQQEAKLDPALSVVSQDNINAKGSDVLAKWTYSPSPKSSTDIQLYYDHTNRTESSYGEIRNTVDFDYQKRLTLNPRQELVWGMGYRQSSNDLTSSEVVSFDLSGETTCLYSAFCQEDITLAENRSRLTIGSKFEHNSYTGFEIQPNIRFLWTPQPRHTFWASVSRAVRTPSYAERYSQFSWVGRTYDDGNYYLLRIIGNKDFKPEELTAYEIGYRVQRADKMSLDWTAYYNVYDNYRSFEPGSPQIVTSPFTYIVIPLTINNLVNVNVYGWEISGKYNITNNWRLSTGYTYCRLDMSSDPESNDTFSVNNDVYYPRKQFQIQSSLDLARNFELDINHYYSGPMTDVVFNVPRWSRTDLRLGWKKAETTEISLGVQNLFNKRHREAYATTNEVATYATRSYYAMFSWRR
ncbi:TonB-dependent receptor [bacterium]|nr:TonB-dependent receptor [bacterium]